MSLPESLDQCSFTQLGTLLGESIACENYSEIYLVMSEIKRRINKVQMPPLKEDKLEYKELTDDDLMPFGKYKNTPLGEVPYSYFVWLYDQDDFRRRNPQLAAYIETHV